MPTPEHSTNTLLPNGWRMNPTRYAGTQGSVDYELDLARYQSTGNAERAVSANWKLHLALPDNRNDPRVREAINFLLTRNDVFAFKVGVGDDEFLRNGNRPIDSGMTIYVGSRDAAEKLGVEISSQLGHVLGYFENPAHVNPREQYVAPGVSMRFDAQKHRFPDSPAGERRVYKQYGAAGLIGAC